MLVVDDEPTIAASIAASIAARLRSEGYAVDVAHDGPSAMTRFEEGEPDLVVLDIMLPGTDGLAVLRRIRADGDVPVVLLTARTDEVDRVVGLELGADDYVVKPFSPRELAARVRNMLRRASAAPPPPAAAALDFGALRVDPGAREVAVDGAVVPLTPKEFDLLHVLARSPRQVFSRSQLLELVWESSPDFQDPATVTVHVGRLRQKLEPDPDHPRWIVTAWGVGYRFEP